MLGSPVQTQVRKHDTVSSEMHSDTQAASLNHLAWPFLWAFAASFWYNLNFSIPHGFVTYSGSPAYRAVLKAEEPLRRWGRGHGSRSLQWVTLTC